MDVNVKIIRDRGEFAAMGEAWNELVDRATLGNTFYRHQWYQCWLESIAPEAEIRIVTLSRGGRLVAAAPLQIVTSRRRGVPIKVLTFLQSGITPRCGLLVQSDDLCGALLAAIDSVEDWSVAELKAMELDHRTTRSFAEQLRGRQGVVIEAGMTSPYEELPDSWDEYYQSRTNKIRQRFRGAVNRVNKNEAVETLRLETYADLEPHFDSLLAISAASWKGAEGTDMATVSQAASFYRNYSRSTDGRGAWIVYLLKLEGKPVAFMYLLRDGSHWVALRSDYDESYSYFQPGVYLHKEVITDLTTLPAPRIYDLVGTATAFKSSLARVGRRLCDVTFASRSAGGRLLVMGKTMLGKRSSENYLDLEQVIAGTVASLTEDADGGPARDSSPGPG